jgi:hypothetical protein
MPGVETERAGKALETRGLARCSHSRAYVSGLAQISVVSAVLGLGSAGCLVTGDSGFEDPQKTPPQLITPQPRPSELITANEALPTLEFGAVLVSEDVDDNLEAVLLIDYGTLGPGGAPWLDDVGEKGILPSTLSQPRNVRLKWPVRPTDVDKRCHSVTMLVTHERYGDEPYTWCPRNRGDFDTVTWFVAFCPGGCATPGSEPPSFDECPANGTDAVGEPLKYCPDDLSAGIPEGQP